MLFVGVISVYVPICVSLEIIGLFLGFQFFGVGNQLHSPDARDEMRQKIVQRYLSSREPVAVFSICAILTLHYYLFVELCLFSFDTQDYVPYRGIPGIITDRSASHIIERSKIFL